MEQRRIGHSGLSVSHLGLGTMTWGRETDADEAAAQLVAFRDAGGTLVDTAASYATGESERVLGQLVADVVPREEIVISTKAGIGPGPDGPIVDASRGQLLSTLDRSLRNLGVEYIDLWSVHVSDESVGFEETLGALDHAVSTGRARYVGVSNYDGWRTARAATWQRSGIARAPITANQSRYNLLERGLEREVIPACLSLGVGVLPYAPLGGGVLTGKYRSGVPSDSRSALATHALARVSEREAGIVEAVATAAQGLMSSPVAVALSWVRDRPGVSAPIVGARTLGQLVAALASETLTLPDEIRRALDDVSEPWRGYPELLD